MAPRTRSAAGSTIQVGGIAVTSEQVQSAIDILTSASGIMVRRPLARAQHLLAECRYHDVATEQRELNGDKKVQTKIAFVAALRRLSPG